MKRILFCLLLFSTPAISDTIQIQIPDGNFESGILGGGGDSHWAGAWTLGGSFFGGGYAHANFSIASAWAIPGTAYTVTPIEGDLFGYAYADQFLDVNNGVPSSSRDAFSRLEHRIYSVQAGDTLIGSYLEYMFAAGGITNAVLSLDIYSWNIATQDVGDLATNLVSGSVSNGSFYTPWTTLAFELPSGGDYVILASTQATAQGVMPEGVPDAGSGAYLALDNFYLEHPVSEPSTIWLLGLGLFGLIIRRIGPSIEDRRK